MVPGGVPNPGGAVIDRTAPAAADRQEVGVHLSSGGKGRGDFLRLFRSTFNKFITQSCSTLLRYLFWTYVRRWRGHQRCGWGCGGESRWTYICKGQCRWRRRQRRSLTRMVLDVRLVEGVRKEDFWVEATVDNTM